MKGGLRLMFPEGKAGRESWPAGRPGSPELQGQRRGTSSTCGRPRGPSSPPGAARRDGRSHLSRVWCLASGELQKGFFAKTHLLR